MRARDQTRADKHTRSKRKGTLQEPLTKQGQETHRRHRGAHALRGLQRPPTGPPISQIQTSSRTEASSRKRGRRRDGEMEKEEERGAKCKSEENGIRLLGWWSVEGCGVEEEQYKSSQPGGKRRRRGGEGGSASAEDAGEGMGTGVVSGRNGTGVPWRPGLPLSCSLARPCSCPVPRPLCLCLSLSPKQARGIAFRSNGKRDRSGETEKGGG